MRVLPDTLLPHVHYCTEVVENVVDGICDSESEQTFDYPVEKTMDRWKNWMDGNKNHVDGAMKSIGSRLPEFGEELLNSEDSLMDKLREEGAGWLSIISRFMWNFGTPLLNPRKLAEVSTDLRGDPEHSDLTCPQEEDNSYGTFG